MKFSNAKRAAVMGAGVMLAFAATLSTATSAQAARSQGYVDGFGNQGDDWNDEGMLQVGDRSNVVAMWQLVLWADGEIKNSNQDRFSWSDIDCSFGPNTKFATRMWQFSNHLDTDGIVGPKTFTRAGEYNLAMNGYFEQVYYAGEFHQVVFLRNTDTGKYYVKLNGDYKGAYYDSASLCD